MSVPAVDAVLEFMRKNGFLEAESVLTEELADKGDLGSFDFEKFIFPVLPPLPPLRIPARSEDAGACGGGAEGSCGSSSDDQFMSLGSYASDACSSSDFVNPYGLQSSSTPDSKTSSDRMSQFGTARAYNDSEFEMQDDLCTYDDKLDEGHLMIPCFHGPEPFLGPSEDKFVMSSDTSVNKNLVGASIKERDETGEHDCISFDQRDHSPEDEKKGSIDSGQLLKEINLNDLESKNLSNVSVPDEYASAGKYLLNRNPDDFMIRVSGEGWFNKSKPCVQSEEDLHLKDIVSTEEPGEGEALGGKDRESDPRDEVLMVEGLEEEDYEVFELRVVHRKNRTGFEENKDFLIVLNTIVAGRYHVTEYLGSAAFSKVVQARDLHTGMDVCLKIIKNDKDFFDQSLDEIKLLKLVNKHDPADEHHILRLYDYFYHQEHLFIVCELLRANLYEFQKFNQVSGDQTYFTLSRLQVITRQCLKALGYLHGLGIIHCDLKPENILIKSYGRTEIKIIDLGSSCFRSDNLCLYVQSRSYRAPEVILGLPYDEKIDLWSLGCILAELSSGEVLFPNDAVAMILARMIGMLGPIDLKMLLKGQETAKYFSEECDLYHVNEETEQVEYIIPEESSLERHLGVSDVGFADFVRSLLEINPKRRPTAKEALEHPWLSFEYSHSR